MDPFIQLLQSNPAFSAGGYGLFLLSVLWMVTGFTIRGWTTPKQQARMDAPRDILLQERKDTADQLLSGRLVDAKTIASQQGTISEIDTFFHKVPVTTPQSGDTVTEFGR